jgi:hypothetical protein
MTLYIYALTHFCSFSNFPGEVVLVCLRSDGGRRGELPSDHGVQLHHNHVNYAAGLLYDSMLHGAIVLLSQLQIYVQTRIGHMCLPSWPRVFAA